jgi:anti-anti-sigma factor
MAMSEAAVEHIEGVSVVHMPRRVDVNNTKAFMDAVRAELANGNRNIVLDLGATETIDSTALGAVVQLFKSLRAQGGDLRIARISEGVRRVFAITRLDRIFETFDSLDAAVNASRQAS